MERWVGKLRGLFGLSAVGAAAGGLFGALWEIGSTWLGLGGLSFGSLGWSAALWAGFGAFAAGGVGVFLAAVGSKRTLEELSVWRAGIGGAVLGSVAPLAMVFAVTGGFWAPSIGYVAGLSGLFGGLLGGGLVLTAKRAHAAELRSSREPDLLSHGR